MSLDTTGSTYYLLGTTQKHRTGSSWSRGGHVYIFRIGLLGSVDNYGIDETNYVCSQLVDASNSFNDDWYVTAIYKNMVTGSSNRARITIYDSMNKSIYYVQINLTTNTVLTYDAVLVYSNIDNIRESTITDVDRSGINGVTVRKTYFAGYAYSVSHSAGTFGSDPTKPMGVIFNSERGNNCFD